MKSKTPNKSKYKNLGKRKFNNPKNSHQIKKKTLINNNLESELIRLNKYIANAGICSRREADNYIRVGTDYFKIIHKMDRHGINRRELKKWSKEEIKLDYYGDRGFLGRIKKYDDFTIHPDNINQSDVIGGCFNMYNRFTHTPCDGSWEWTEVLLRHVFGEILAAEEDDMLPVEAEPTAAHYRCLDLGSLVVNG